MTHCGRSKYGHIPGRSSVKMAVSAIFDFEIMKFYCLKSVQTQQQAKCRRNWSIDSEDITIFQDGGRHNLRHTDRRTDTRRWHIRHLA